MSGLLGVGLHIAQRTQGAAFEIKCLKLWEPLKLVSAFADMQVGVIQGQHTFTNNEEKVNKELALFRHLSGNPWNQLWGKLQAGFQVAYCILQRDWTSAKHMWKKNKSWNDTETNLKVSIIMPKFKFKLKTGTSLLARCMQGVSRLQEGGHWTSAHSSHLIRSDWVCSSFSK